jgi:hypothetical protein
MARADDERTLTPIERGIFVDHRPVDLHAQPRSGRHRLAAIDDRHGIVDQ